MPNVALTQQDMSVLVSSVIRITNPTMDVNQWIKKTLVLPNPEFKTKVKLGIWVGDTPEKVYLFAVDGDDVVVPYGCLRDIKRLAPYAKYSYDFPTDEGVRYSSSGDIPLYPYQSRAVEEAKVAGYGIIQAPAGCGKTQIGLALGVALQRRTLWISPTIDLMEQAKSRMEQFYPRVQMGVIAGGKVILGKYFTFSTIQMLSKVDLRKYDDFFGCIIVDECHRVAGSESHYTQFSRVLNMLKCRHKYGLSATVHRADGMIGATFSLLGGIICTITDEEVADKIKKVRICPVQTGTKLPRGAVRPDGMINHPKLISGLCENKGRNAVIASYLRRQKGKSCLILGDRLEHLENLMEALPKEIQAESAFISGTTGEKKRKKVLEDMRNGNKKFLFATYALAKEGLDIPRLERLFLATPQKDYAIVTQAVGRIARSFPGKDDPIVFDFVDDFELALRYYNLRCRHYRKLQASFITVQEAK